MNWNYRVMVKTYVYGSSKEPQLDFAIYEVYYENDKPTSCTLNAMSLEGFNSVEELKEAHEMMLEAYSLPILWYDEDKFGQVYEL